MIEWRRTAGGVEIAEFEQYTAMVHADGYIAVFADGKQSDFRDCADVANGKKWFEYHYCRPKYTVTRYPDGGEVYVSEDGQRVAMVSYHHGDWWYMRGGQRGYSGTRDVDARQHAIDYVSKETA
jgi:hypothetical protein